MRRSGSRRSPSGPPRHEQEPCRPAVDLVCHVADTRGGPAFFPQVDGRTFGTLEIPTTLPTFDELLGRREFPDGKVVGHYTGLLRDDLPNVFTLHAEIEGMSRRGLFRDLLAAWTDRGVRFLRMDDLARRILAERERIPVGRMVMTGIDGRSGLVAARDKGADGGE